MELGCKNQFSTRCRTSVRSRTSILALSCTITTVHRRAKRHIYPILWAFGSQTFVCRGDLDLRWEEAGTTTCQLFESICRLHKGARYSRPSAINPSFIECFMSFVQSSMTMGACRDVLVSPQSFKNRDVAMAYEQDHELILNSWPPDSL